MLAGEIFWDIVPYVTIAILVVGTWWRYRYDKFGLDHPILPALREAACCGSAARCFISASWW